MTSVRNDRAGTIRWY